MSETLPWASATPGSVPTVANSDSGNDGAGALPLRSVPPIALLPEKLQELIARSTKLQAEVRRLDATMHAPTPVRIAVGNPVERQLGLLKAAFEQDGL